MDGRMTEGSIAKLLIRFSIPLVLSGLLQQLYSWADALIVGNFSGEAALAAIGATGTVSGMFIALIAGFSVGVSILVSQAYGEGDEPAIARTAATFITVLTVASLLLTVIAMLLSRPLLSLLGTPEDILEPSTTYLTLVLLGLPCLAVYNIYSAILRGIGDSRTPFLAIVVSSVANVLLDLLFIAVFGWGVAGAAVATALSQLLMAAFLVLYTPRAHAMLRFKLRGMVSRDTLRDGLTLSLPTALQGGIRSVGGLLLQNIMNSFGTQVVAAITTAYRIDSLGLLPTINVGSGVSTFTAQNKGAGNLERARHGLRVGTIISLVTSLVTTVFFVLCGAALMRMFGVSEGAVAIGREFLYICAIFYPLFGIQSAFIGYLQGMGDVRFTTIVTLSSLAMRILLSYLFASIAGHRIIAYSEMVSWVYALVICVVRYWVKFRKPPAQE